jgi:hypothetical protein
MEGLRRRGEPKCYTSQTVEDDRDMNDDQEDDKPLMGRDSPTPKGAMCGNVHTWADRIQHWFVQVFGKICEAMPFTTSGPEVTPAQLAQLQPFGEYAGIPFDHSNEEHQAALRTLWSLFSNGQEVPHSDLIFPEWKDFGFQQPDPGSDFRAVGVFGIHNLLFFADAYPTQFRRMCPETDGGYPFAIAGLNISMMLLAMLDVTGRKTCFTTTHAQNTTQAKKSRYAFVELMLRSTNGESPNLRQMENVFGTVYCMAFLVLDKHWQDLKNPNMLAFNDVLVKVKKHMDEVLMASKTLEDVSRVAGV